MIGRPPSGRATRASHRAGSRLDHSAGIPDALWEVLADGYIAHSGKRWHASDCATSSAPAECPGPCDCDFPAVGPWMPIRFYNERQHGKDVLICGGTIRYDAETFPEDEPYLSAKVARLEERSGEWDGGYGSEYDGTYWHNPEWFTPLAKLPAQGIEAFGEDALAASSRSDESPVPKGDAPNA